jgi:chromosome segregation protein
VSRRRKTPDVGAQPEQLDARAQLEEAKKREQTARETLSGAIRATFDLSEERERLERAVAYEDSMHEAISDLSEKATAADEEARAAEQSAAALRREADTVELDDARVAAVKAGLSAAYERTEALGLALEDAVVTGKPDAMLQRLSHDQEDAAVTARAFEAERSVLAELTASADRLRGDAAAQLAVAAAARDRASLRRAEALEVPEVARKMAVAEWREKQRAAKRTQARKPTQAPLHALISDGRLLHDVTTGLAYDLDGRPIVSPFVG